MKRLKAGKKKAPIKRKSSSKNGGLPKPTTLVIQPVDKPPKPDDGYYNAGMQLASAGMQLALVRGTMDRVMAEIARMRREQADFIATIKREVTELAQAAIWDRNNIETLVDKITDRRVNGYKA